MKLTDKTKHGRMPSGVRSPGSTASGGFPLRPSLKFEIPILTVRGSIIPDRFSLEGGMR